MQTIINRIIRKKNPSFAGLDTALPTHALPALLSQKGIQWLRSCKLLFRGMRPNHWFLGKGVSIFLASKVKMGKWVQLEDGVHLSGLGTEGIRIGNNVRIGAFSRLVASTTFDQPGKGIRIGNNVGIGEFAYLGGAGGLSIGDNCIIGQYFSCHPENHQFSDPAIQIRHQGTSRKGIEIGEDCWIGSKVTILDGVRIGRHCVIAAGAVVNQSFPDHSVIGGVPARLLKNTKA